LLYQTGDATNILSIYISDSGYIFFGNWGGIVRSTDGGENWTEVLDLYNTEVVKAIAENSQGVLFAGSTSYSGDVSPGGIYSSTDGGATWQLTGLDYHFVSSIVINEDDEIFAGTNGNWNTGTGRIYKSSDNGQSWNIVFDNHYILSLSINEYNEIASASETGIFCTYDSGLAWNEITPFWAGKYFEKVAFHPEGQLYAISYFVESDLFRTLEPVIIPDNIVSQGETKIYPNPAINLLFIETYNVYYDEIYITDLSGRIMKKVAPSYQNIIEIQIEGLPPSVYLIHCKNDYNISTVKFIKY